MPINNVVPFPKTAKSLADTQEIGLCPYCKNYNVLLNDGPTVWLFCRAHKVKWSAMRYLRSPARLEERKIARFRLSEYRTVQPYFPVRR